MTRIFLALLAVAALSACNTLAGAGQDLTATGNAITSGSRDVQSGL